MDELGDLPPLNADVSDSLGYPSAMVTGLRFDPCFPGLGAPSCEAQLRLVLQPVITSAGGVHMLDDAAVHVFYRLSSDEAEDVVDELVAIRGAAQVSTDGPLRIHPELSRDPAGEAGDRIGQLVVDHCRVDNLTRVTLNTFAFDIWTFARFDVVGQALVRRDLEHLAAPEPSQSWQRRGFVGGLDQVTGELTPAPADPGLGFFLREGSFAGGAPTDAAAAQAAAAALLRMENPRETTTDDVDCGSCHIATQVRLFARRNGVDFDLPEAYRAPDGFDDRLVLDPALDGNVGATIAFGWHHQIDGQGERSLPSISQRVVNESIDIADHLSD